MLAHTLYRAAVGPAALLVVLLASPCLAQRVVPNADNPYAWVPDEEVERIRAQQPSPRPKPPWLADLNERWRWLDDLGIDGDEGTALNLEQAHLLVDQFFFDWGDRAANALWQESILDRIKIEAFGPINAEVREVLRDGVFEYLDGGGGAGHQGDMIEVAEALLAVAEDDDHEALLTARTLLEEARHWAEAVGKPFWVEVADKTYAGHFGPQGRYAHLAGQTQAGDQQSPAAAAGERGQHAAAAGETASTDSSGKRSAPDLEEAYRRFRQLARELGRVRQVKAPQLREFAELSRRLLGKDAAAPDTRRRDVIRRTLEVYGRLLAARGRLSESAVGVIDGELLWLARDSGVLGDASWGWNLWTRAAMALRADASPALRSYVRERCADAATRGPARRACERVAAVLDSKP